MEIILGLFDRFKGKSVSSDEKTTILKAREGEIVLLPSFVLNSIKTVYSNTSTGYAFFPDVKMKTLTDNIRWMSLRTSNRGGDLYENILTKKVGWDLVRRTKDAMSLKDAVRTRTKKIEDGQTIDVVGVQTSQPLSDFETGFMTIVLKQTPGGALPDDVRNNEKIVIASRNGSVFTMHSIRPGAAIIYGSPVPPASQWNDEYAVVIPDTKKKEMLKVNFSTGKSNDFNRISEEIKRDARKEYDIMQKKMREEAKKNA